MINFSRLFMRFLNPKMAKKLDEHEAKRVEADKRYETMEIEYKKCSEELRAKLNKLPVKIE